MKKPKLSKKMLLIVGIVLLMLIVVGIILVFFVFKPGDSTVEASDESVTSEEAENSEIPTIGQDQSYYNFYNQIELNMSKAEVNQRLGMEPIMEADGSFHYTDINTGYSVNVFFNVNDQVVLKALIPPIGGGDWIDLCTADVSQSQVDGITAGMTYQEVKKHLGGDGLLRIEMIETGTTDHVIYGLAWMNADFSYILVSFDGDTQKVIGSIYSE
ncbi:MAG: hypothetical protein PWP16_161 [Eubacteriaceae bacterium]|jgi:hypothetical protein|nr:hypothetical protein [Eubacteriaceae bacterium]MDN5306798.1 hypothetical protein [Eubacteriaceae bacterium]